MTVVNAGDSDYQASAITSRRTRCVKVNTELKARSKKLIDYEPFSFYLSAWEEDK